MNRLFGHLTYDLQAESDDISRIFILYGDNGSGKTTILNCIFHLLSPATNRGHRGALAKVPFSRFSVTLGNGAVVTARRTPDSLIGSFEMSLYSEAFDGTVPIEADANLKVKSNRAITKPLFDALRDLGLRLHLLSDERKIAADSNPDEDEEDVDDLTRFVRERTRTNQPRNGLDVAVQRAIEAVRKQAIAGSGAGDVNANTLYTNIVQQIVSPYLRPRHKEIVGLRDLIDDLIREGARSNSFARFGLSSELPVDDLLVALNSSGAVEHADVLHQILRPYIDGFKVRLDALQALHDKLRTFVDTVNVFFRGKTVSLSLGPGLVVASEHGGLINRNVLSSGEKQLLLLLCNVLAVGTESSIFIIDEPELSLNVKWQRKLVDALLDCTQGTDTQFVLATHSLELLTRHQHNVLKLESGAA